MEAGEADLYLILFPSEGVESISPVEVDGQVLPHRVVAHQHRGQGAAVQDQRGRDLSSGQLGQAGQEVEVRGRLGGRYPAFSLVELLHCCALIGPELQSGEIFSGTERSYYRRT